MIISKGRNETHEIKLTYNQKLTNDKQQIGIRNYEINYTKE